ncbi:MAG TPA: hypothetical protein PKG71_01570 [Candidatus Woesebacteria bacterium]|nr:hypothetical protein [Candidatus Woesebacteria bacterium]HNS94633.1 hypothetical protein [Candidatus Woesebacteria bacterium]
MNASEREFKPIVLGREVYRHDTTYPWIYLYDGSLVTSPNPHRNHSDMCTSSTHVLAGGFFRIGSDRVLKYDYEMGSVSADNPFAWDNGISAKFAQTFGLTQVMSVSSLTSQEMQSKRHKAMAEALRAARRAHPSD